MVAARSVVLALVAALALVACKRPSPEDCEVAIRNWHSLVYWESAEAEIAKAPPEQREALRAQKTAAKDKTFEEGIGLAVMQCRAARDFDAVKCMKAAQNYDDAIKCRPVKKPE